VKKEFLNRKLSNKIINI